MPPVRTFAQARIIAEGFRRLGMRVGPAPMAVTSTEYRGRPACVYDGWCDAGCPVQALANPLVVHKPAAEAAGAEFRAYANVTRVETDSGGRAVALHYVGQNGQRHVQPAGLVILAGAAVQNARLLLASAGGRHPEGIGNRSGLVGRYFNMHLLANVHGLFAEETECHLGLSSGGLMSQDGYEKARQGPFGSYSWGIAPALKPNDLIGIANTRPDLMGPALHDFLERASRHIGVMNGIVESLPEAQNRVELAPERDRSGMPLARIVHSAPEEAKGLWRHANDEGMRIMRSAGAPEPWTVPVPTFAHLSGGTIMGDDPANSVANSYGQLHDVPNVVVAGAGLFPTIGAVSPTFTVLALADRAAGRMADHWAEFA